MEIQITGDLVAFKHAKQAFELAYVSQAMERAEANVTKAAALAKVDTSHFYVILKRCGFYK